MVNDLRGADVASAFVVGFDGFDGFVLRDNSVFAQFVAMTFKLEHLFAREVGV
jgi:hypothetical protein